MACRAAQCQRHMEVFRLLSSVLYGRSQRQAKRSIISMHILPLW